MQNLVDDACDTVKFSTPSTRRSMAEDSESGWQLTESDPGVFSELLHKLGVPLIVDDLYSLDTDSLALLKPIHALIFLFKYVGGSDSGVGAAGGTSRSDPDFGGFFAHQTVNNACATLAVLNALGNLPNVTKVSTNEEYKNLMGFAGDLDPQSRGMVITSADWLREAHNSLSPPSAISLDGLGLERGIEDVRSLSPFFFVTSREHTTLMHISQWDLYDTNYEIGFCQSLRL